MIRIFSKSKDSHSFENESNLFRSTVIRTLSQTSESIFVKVQRFAFFQSPSTLFLSKFIDSDLFKVTPIDCIPKYSYRNSNIFKVPRMDCESRLIEFFQSLSIRFSWKSRESNFFKDPRFKFFQSPRIGILSKSKQFDFKVEWLGFGQSPSNSFSSKYLDSIFVKVHWFGFFQRPSIQIFPKSSIESRKWNISEMKNVFFSKNIFLSLFLITDGG